MKALAGQSLVAVLVAPGVAERRGVAHEQVEQGHRIRAGPFAQRPRLVPAHRPRGGEADQSAPAAQVDDRHRAVGPAAQDAEGAVRQRRFDPPFGEALIDPVQQPRKTAGEEAGDEPAAGGEAAVRRDEMSAPLRGHAP